MSTKDYKFYTGEAHESLINANADDIKRIYDQLSKAFFLRTVDTHEPIPVLSNFHYDGVVIPVYSDRSGAEKMGLDMASAYKREIEVSSLGGLWDRILEFAHCGFVGLILNEDFPVYFYNRLTDMDRTFPSTARVRLIDSR